MVYLELHPVDPALERLFAQMTSVIARCAGNSQITEDDFYLRKPEPGLDEERGESGFADMLRARVRARRG